MTDTPKATMTPGAEAVYRKWAEENLPPDDETMRLFAALDASRAETEAVRQRLHDVVFDYGSIRQREVELRSLAAELVEGLAEAVDWLERDGLGGTFSNLVALLTRARAQGIGEKEKGGG